MSFFIIKICYFHELNVKQAVKNLAFFANEENMKKLILIALPTLLAACSTPVQQSSVPMDMQAVADYQHLVATKQTVNPNEKPNDEPLNQSDKRAKSTVTQSVRPVIYPSIGVGYHHGFGRYRHWY